MGPCPSRRPDGVRLASACQRPALVNDKFAVAIVTVGGAGVIVAQAA